MSQDTPEMGLKDVLMKYLMHWKWFVISVIFSIGLAWVYLRYQAPLYEVSATVLIKDDKNGNTSLSDEMAAFEDLGILKSNKNIDNEIEILKSRTLMSRVVRDLQLTVAYFSFGRPIYHEKYEDSPILMTYRLNDPTVENITYSWSLIPKSDQTFELKEGENAGKEFHFGDTLIFPHGKVSFRVTRFFNNGHIGNPFRAVMLPMERVTSNYLAGLDVSSVNKTSSVLKITMKDYIPEKAKDIINNLIKQHNQDAIEDKNQMSQNTADFIGDRIRFITEELSDVESQVEHFKKENKLTDIQMEADLMRQSGSQSEAEIISIGSQMKLNQFVLDDLNKRSASLAELLPANLGLQDASVTSMIWEYNKLVLDRNRLVKSGGEQNPVVHNLENKLVGLRNSLRESLETSIQTLNIRLKDLEKQERGLEARISDVPEYEREYRNIQRQQQIKESLYLYLLQKREETNIALAVTVANAKVIDEAFGTGVSVAPKKQMIYITAIFFGFLLPMLFLYILELFDTKVYGRKDLEYLKMPFLGDIPETQIESRLFFGHNDRSVVSESFRLLRTNLDFLCADVKTGSRTIFVTSTVSKEGKSLIAINLAAAFAASGKKTLLLGTDLRHPKITAYLDINEKKGFTNFLIDPLANLEDFILRYNGQFDFDILASGPIPPNPAELLMHDKIRIMFNELKSSYDYIIVDTAPVGLVADTLLLNKYSDCTVFVVRANYLDKRMLEIVHSLFKERRLNNMSLLINGQNAKRGYKYGYSYGYGYGYGYDYTGDLNKRKKDSFFKNIFKIISNSFFQKLKTKRNKL